MKNTTRTILIIALTLGFLVTGYVFVVQESTVPEPNNQSDGDVSQITTTTDGSDREGTSSEDVIKNIREVDMDIAEPNLTINIPSNLNTVLSGWISDWQSVDSSINFDGFKFASEEEFAFPFNEVFLDERFDTVPNFEEGNVYSPNGDMYLNYLYSYERPEFSGVVLVNPRDEDRAFRVAYCQNYCKYHGAWWLSDTKFVTGAIMEDSRVCDVGTPWEECPETLVFDVYDLDSMRVAHFTYERPLGDLKGSFPEVRCEDYPPCSN